MPNVYVEDAFGNIRGVDPSEMADFNRNKARVLSMIGGTLDTSGLSGSERADAERGMTAIQQRSEMGEDAFAVLQRQREKEPTNPGGSAFTQAQQDRMAAGAAAGIAATGSPFGTVLSDIKKDYNYITSGNALSDLKSNLSTGIADLKTDFGYGDVTQGYTDRLPGRLAAAEAANLNMLSNNRDSRPSDIITGVSEDVVVPGTDVVVSGTDVVVPGTDVEAPIINVFDPESKTYTIRDLESGENEQYSYGSTYGEQDLPADVAYSKQVQENRAAMGLESNDSSAWSLYQRGEHYSQIGSDSIAEDSIAEDSLEEVIPGTDYSGQITDLTDQLGLLQGNYSDLLGQFNTMSEQLSQMSNYQGGGSQDAAASPVYQNILPTSSTSYTPASLLPLQGVGTSNIKLPASYEKSKPLTFEKYLDYYDEIYPSEEIV